jgi:C-terminal processing protease CtpA/Prc
VLAVDLLHRTQEESVTFVLERSDGSMFEITLPCLDYYVDFRFRERKHFCEHAELESGIHRIRIPQFTWNEAAFSRANSDSEREEALAEAKTQIDDAFADAENAAGLILDLRGNSGGYELLSSFVAEHLVPGDFLYYSLTRHNSEFIRSLPAYAQADPVHFGVPLPTYPRRWEGFRHFTGVPFTGKLVVLINQRCFSTTDNLCAFLKDARPDTQFVGQPTGGGTGEPLTVGTLNTSNVPVQYCVSVIHSPAGRLIEGVGTIPDLLVEPTREDLVQRRDPALEAAIELLTSW